VFQAAQGGHACLRLILLCPGGLERVLVERAAAMSEESAETRGYHSAHLPPRQRGTALDAEDSPVRVVVADEGNEQGADQRDQPYPVEIGQHGPHLRPAGHVGQPDSGRQFQHYRHAGQQGQDAPAAPQVNDRQPRQRYAHQAGLPLANATAAAR
jgi:hypothetical protein